MQFTPRSYTLRGVTETESLAGLPLVSYTWESSLCYTFFATPRCYVNRGVCCQLFRPAYALKLTILPMQNLTLQELPASDDSNAGNLEGLKLFL